MLLFNFLLDGGEDFLLYYLRSYHTWLEKGHFFLQRNHCDSWEAENHSIFLNPSHYLKREAWSLKKRSSHPFFSFPCLQVDTFCRTGWVLEPAVQLSSSYSSFDSGTWTEFWIRLVSLCCSLLSSLLSGLTIEFQPSLFTAASHSSSIAVPLPLLKSAQKIRTRRKNQEENRIENSKPILALGNFFDRPHVLDP